jgi:hypothetical protein
MQERAVYAQTNTQLFGQLRREHYSVGDQRLVLAAYDLATELFTGYFTGTGRTQIAHVVGTASILCSLHAPAALVAAALVHNVYATGDFGDGRRGVSPARRRQIRDAVGAHVEEYAYRFPTLNGAALPAVSDALAPLDREILLIIVADWLEHRLNAEYPRRQGLGMADCAEHLGFPALAAEIRHAVSAPDELDVDLARERRRPSGTVAPRSYRRKLTVALPSRLRDGLRHLVDRFVQRRSAGGSPLG